VPVDGEVLEIGTALDEYIPESMLPRYGFVDVHAQLSDT
jgi:hypothetical protein